MNGTLVERINAYLSEPKIMTKDTVTAACLLYEVLENTASWKNKKELEDAQNRRIQIEQNA